MDEVIIPICFVIMPISDNENYPEGHFDRVYYHIIAPACKNAGFKPVRADDMTNTNYIALDVIKKIVESDMVLCDLSSQNPNVLYELGIRQAFNKPVALIKDKKTKRIFDIQGFRDFEYDETLRVDTVVSNIEKLAQAIVSTYEENGNDINSLVSLLSLNPAKIDHKTEISNETRMILNSISALELRLNSIEESNPKNEAFNFNYKSEKKSTLGYSQIELPENVGEEFSKNELDNLKPGDNVFAIKFGFGKVIKKEKLNNNSETLKAEIQFEEFGNKVLLLSFARLRKVS